MLPDLATDCPEGISDTGDLGIHPKRADASASSPWDCIQTLFPLRFFLHINLRSNGVSLTGQLWAALSLGPPFFSFSVVLPFSFSFLYAYFKSIGLLGLWGSLCHFSIMAGGSLRGADGISSHLLIFALLLPNLLYPFTPVLPFPPLCLLCWPRTM